MENAINCKHCGRQVKEDWKLCPWCGWTVVKETDKISGVILVIGERKKIRDAAGTIAGFKSVRDVFVVTGEADIAVKATAPTFNELRSFVMDSVSGVEGVVDTRTYMVLSSLKEMNENPPDPGKDPVRTIILLKVEQDKKEEIGRELISLETVEDVLQVTGDADMVVKSLFPNYLDMKKFVSETLANMDGVKEQKTFMAVTIFKEHGQTTSEVPASPTVSQDVYFRRPEKERNVMEILTNLPRGVPSSLWGLEIDELAEEIMGARYGLSPRGYPLVKIRGKWYRGDIDDRSTYLQSYEGEVLETK